MKRRSFVVTLGVSALAAASMRALADGTELPKVDPADAQASALGYIHNAEEVDKAKHPRYEAGQSCSNCVLFQGQGDAEWGGCGIFPGKAVSSSGWCSAWAKKPS